LCGKDAIVEFTTSVIISGGGLGVVMVMKKRIVLIISVAVSIGFGESS
jgi:hypothetical protein